MLWDRLQRLFQRKQLDSQLDEELTFHLEMRERRNRESGMSSGEARSAAMKRFGNRLRMEERCREARGFSTLETAARDMRQSLRVLRKSPGFALAAITLLALGIGSGAAMFSIIDGVLLRPLPFHDPDRLVRVFGTYKGSGSYPLSDANFLDYRDQARSFELIAGWTERPANLTGAGEPERVLGAMVTANFFDVLGVPPALGRTFLTGEDQLGKHTIVVLSHELWERRFGLDPRVLGKIIVADGEGLVVVGVMPRGFSFPKSAELWRPTVYDTKRRDVTRFNTIARLRKDVALAQAKAEVDHIAGALARAYPETNSEARVALVSLHDSMVGGSRQTLLTLFGAVSFLLLIAIANLANLMLVRAAGRRKELSIRLALGGSRGRILRQLLTESLTLALAGGAAGLLLAHALLRGLLVLAPASIPRLDEVAMDWRVLAFTLSASILAGVLFGILPAVCASRQDASHGLREGGTAPTAGAASSVTRGILSIAEVTLATVLLVGAGLMIRSLYLLTAVNPGFDAERVITMQVSLPKAKYGTPERLSAFYEDVLQRMHQAPGVIAASAASCVPLTNCGTSTYLFVEGRPLTPNTLPPLTSHRSVTPQYFRALGIPLLRGRLFQEHESTDVAIISDRMARRLWPGEDPIGKRISLGGTGYWREVIGVVGDIRNNRLENPPDENTYLLHRQWVSLTQRMTFVVRTKQEPEKLAGILRSQIGAVDKVLPVSGVRTMEYYLTGATSLKRFQSVLLGAFAALALVVASLGMYAVLAYSVAQRRHEIGIRVALGARREQIITMVLRQAGLLVTAGLACGFAAAFPLARMIESYLFGVRPTDPATYLLVAAVFLAVSVLASYAPARHATAVDPVIALRCE